MQIWNQTTFLERLMNDKALAKDVLDSFLDDVPKQLQQIRDYLEEKDFHGLERQAHTLAGASLNISADSLYQAARSLEKDTLNKDETQARAHMEDICVKFELLSQTIKRFLNNKND